MSPLCSHCFLSSALKLCGARVPPESLREAHGRSLKAVPAGTWDLGTLTSFGTLQAAAATEWEAYGGEGTGRTESRAFRKVLRVSATNEAGAGQGRGRAEGRVRGPGALAIGREAEAQTGSKCGLRRLCRHPKIFRN